jgi:hypothetical protein
MSTTAQQLLIEVVEEPEILAQQMKFDDARKRFLTIATRFLDEGRPLLAAHVLYRTLRLPGQSSEVYENLGRAALAMDCEKEALQHLKTAGWLALKSSDRTVSTRVLAELEKLAPDDPWLEKNRAGLRGSNIVEGQRCRFCGRTAKEAGPLIEGSEAAVCSGCVKRLMSLDAKSD